MPNHSQPTFSEALPTWTKIGLLSFGGPAGQIALMQDEVVTRRGWVPPESFDRGLAFSMMLPGPEAQQLATWLGWRLHGLAGGLVAGLAFILPGAALMILLAWIAAAYGELPLVSALFAGVQPVVIALVLSAMTKIGARALKAPAHWALAFAAFIALNVFSLPFPLVVAAAALVGLMLPGQAQTTAAPRGGPVIGHAVPVLLGAAALLGTVYLSVDVPRGGEVAALFTTAALVTFGGAYAVLPFVAEHAVSTYGWLVPEQMLNGLAIAEATPGPLILVNTYAGFFAGWQGETPDFSAGATTAMLATFYTFVPSFALILAFAPAVERLHSIPLARKALAGVSAAVVGVIANLVLFLAEAAFFPGGYADPDWAKLVLFGLALPLVFLLRLGMLGLVGAGLAAGLGMYLTGLG